jgi:hypothetical protein
MVFPRRGANVGSDGPGRMLDAHGMGSEVFSSYRKSECDQGWTSIIDVVHHSIGLAYAGAESNAQQSAK